MKPVWIVGLSVLFAVGCAGGYGYRHCDVYTAGRSSNAGSGGTAACPQCGSADPSVQVLATPPACGAGTYQGRTPWTPPTFPTFAPQLPANSPPPAMFYELPGKTNKPERLREEPQKFRRETYIPNALPNLAPPPPTIHSLDLMPPSDTRSIPVQIEPPVSQPEVPISTTEPPVSRPAPPISTIVPIPTTAPPVSTREPPLSRVETAEPPQASRSRSQLLPPIVEANQPAGPAPKSLLRSRVIPVTYYNDTPEPAPKASSGPRLLPPIIESKTIEPVQKPETSR